MATRRDKETNFVSCGRHARHTAHKQSAEQRDQDTSAKEKSTKHDCVKCYHCGSAKHKANYIQCPARDKKCASCSKTGHFKACCRTNAGINNMQLPANSDLFDLFTCNDILDTVDLDQLSRYTIIFLQTAQKFCID